jgi:hypothetical protein
MSSCNGWTSAGGERRIQYGWSWGAERERFPGRQESVSLRPLRSVVTWENGSEHSGSLCFADTEEVTGSNPVAPTNKALTSGNAAGPFPSHGRRGEESTLPVGKRSRSWDLCDGDRLSGQYFLR